MAALRTGEVYASSQGAAGFASGNGATSNSVWFKPFANWGDQKLRKGIAGFDSETYGMSFGGDVKIDQSTIGMSFSYSNTDVDSKGVENAQNDIDSYQVTAYADYTTNEWYVEALVGYARNEIDTSRTITLPGLIQTASAEYGSNQYMINIGAGMPTEVAPAHFLTPTASFQYTRVENETYSETGASALNLRVNQDTINVALMDLGVRYHTNSEEDMGTWTPELRAGITYDFAGDDGQSTSVFNGGGAAFQTTGLDVVEFGYRGGLGLGFTPTSTQGLTLSANYDLWAKEDFMSHSANLTIRMDF
jgi:outer membrane autotransporter protein